MVHIHGKFKENTAMGLRVAVRERNVTDGGRLNISGPGPSAR